VLRPVPHSSSPAPGSTPLPAEPTSDRHGPVMLTLAEALATLAGDRPHVQLVLAGAGETVTGELRAVGGDVLTVRQAGEPPASLYVRLASVTECSVFGSG